jgi:hypothetical protein
MPVTDQDIVDEVFENWIMGETTSEFALERLSRIAEGTLDNDAKDLAIASLETVKANS